MAVFFVNGTEVNVPKNQKLLRYLRDELHLTSVKDGCSEGACGACTVLIDGEPCRACTPSTDALEGRHILTVEGLTDEEKKLYTYAYGEAGAVQCGFCIPGMVICTKALLDQNPDPNEKEIKNALRNNYCRCTGYVKIIAAVKLAAKLKREGVIPEPSENDWKVGSSVHRLDVEEKVLGTGKYPDDWYVPNMTYGSAVRAKYARARVKAIDASKALAMPGVYAVLTAEDIPGENKVGHIKHDQYTLIPVGGLTHYLGDAICLVVAQDQETLEKAKKLVKVDYEVLPAVHNPWEAAEENAPHVFDEEGRPCAMLRAATRRARSRSPNTSSRSILKRRGPSTHSWSRSAPSPIAISTAISCSSLPTSPRIPRCMNAHCCSAQRRSRCRTSSSAAASAARRTCPCSTTPRSSPT